MRIPTVQLLTEWLKAHLQSLQQWSDPATGRVYDPFESHQHDARIPAESYSPATALRIEAAAARIDPTRPLGALHAYCRRILELLADENTPPFTALFLQYFGLLACRDLQLLAGREAPAMGGEEVRAFRTALCTYQDRLDTPINANCAAMQAGVEFLRLCHGEPAGVDRCKQRLEIVWRQQSDSGLINDDLAGPSMPVAYHMFCLYLLATSLAQTGAVRIPAAFEEPIRLANQIVGKGYAWLGHLLANDGMVAQYGRSRYHPFAQATGAALLAAAGVEPEDASVRRFLTWMDSYRLGTGNTTGLVAPVFAVTPNHCPPSLRVGFEDYATISVYNNLAIAILVDALDWWTGVLPPTATASEARKAFYNAARARGCHADAQVGLACLRNPAGYVLVNLRADHRRTTPTGSLIHLRLGDDLHEKAVGPPFWADPRVSADHPGESVWEGPLLCAAGHDLWASLPLPALLLDGQTLSCQTTASSVHLQGIGPGAAWTKTILLGPGSVTLSWHLTPEATDQAIVAVVPCLLWDGQRQTTLRFTNAEVYATVQDRRWRLVALDGQGKPLPGSWFLPPDRSRLSISGITGRLQMVVRERTTAGAAVAWQIRIERLP
jgi:hypothetical protein